MKINSAGLHVHRCTIVSVCVTMQVIIVNVCVTHHNDLLTVRLQPFKYVLTIVFKLVVVIYHAMQCWFVM